MPMTPINNALLNIIYDKDECCLLCFDPVAKNAQKIQDEVVLTDKQYSEKLGIILTSILGTEIADSSCLDSVCSKCVESALSCYSFISKCRDNYNSLSKTIDSLTTCVENTDDFTRVKTLFISLNTDSFTTYQYYDTGICLPIETAESEHFKPLPVPCSSKNNVHKSKEQTVTPIEVHKSKNLEVNNSVYDIKDIGSVRINERGNKIYSCKFCPNRYNHLRWLQSHNKGIHLKNFQPDLQVCEKNNSATSCPICNKVYHDQRSFLKHACKSEMKSPQLEKIFTCDDCGAEFIRKNSLVLHIQYEHDIGMHQKTLRRGKQFYSVSSLKHKVQHTKKNKYKCGKCREEFFSRASLMNHVRIHMGQKSFKCQYCDLSFLSTSKRADHTREKHMEPTLCCGICPKMFKSYPELSKHRKKHTNPNSSLFVQ